MMAMNDDDDDADGDIAHGGGDDEGPKEPKPLSNNYT